MAIMSTASPFFERYVAFRSAMTLAGVPVDEAFCIKRHSTDMDVPLSALPELPEVFLCANDFIAVDTMQALRKLANRSQAISFYAGSTTPRNPGS